jgi:uncharacterized membrane-anchored protein YhcB (DUF1043 family)
MRPLILKLGIITAIVLTGAVRSNCQNESPDVFKQGTIPEQLKYLDDHTRIYENYRAIREDMYRNISRNTLDTLAKVKKTIYQLTMHTAALDRQIDSLQKSLEASGAELKKMSRTKNSISVLGMEVSKVPYNTVMFAILGALIFLLVTGYLAFRLNRITTLKTKKDLDELKAEFEEYRTKTRLEREKMSIDHFNEIKKLKGK